MALVAVSGLNDVLIRCAQLQRIAVINQAYDGSVICKDRKMVSLAMHIICEGKAAIYVHHLGHWICHYPADQFVMLLTW